MSCMDLQGLCRTLGASKHYNLSKKLQELSLEDLRRMSHGDRGNVRDILDEELTAAKVQLQNLTQRENLHSKTCSSSSSWARALTYSVAEMVAPVFNKKNVQRVREHIDKLEKTRTEINLMIEVENWQRKRSPLLFSVGEDAKTEIPSSPP